MDVMRNRHVGFAQLASPSQVDSNALRIASPSSRVTLPAAPGCQACVGQPRFHRSERTSAEPTRSHASSFRRVRPFRHFRSLERRVTRRNEDVVAVIVLMRSSRSSLPTSTGKSRGGTEPEKAVQRMSAFLKPIVRRGRISSGLTRSGSPEPALRVGCFVPASLGLYEQVIGRRYPEARHQYRRNTCRLYDAFSARHRIP